MTYQKKKAIFKRALALERRAVHEALLAKASEARRNYRFELSTAAAKLQRAKIDNARRTNQVPQS
ncbi:TPA: hypothetical protein ACH3X3_003257 [Trebouxia sp. C0006]